MPVTEEEKIHSAIPPNGKPPKILVGNLYRIRFRFKGNVAEKLFLFEGHPGEATQRAMRHCALNGYFHIWTEQAIHDLDSEDTRAQTRGGE